MKQVDIPISLMGEPEHVLSRYRELVASGKCAPKLAEILATRKCPGVETDTSHYAGLKPLEETCGKHYAEQVKAEARAAGIAISDNSRFNATVADGRRGADPNAWLHAGDGASTLKNRLRKQGRGLEEGRLGENLDMVSSRMEKQQAVLDKRKQRRIEMSKGAVTE